MDFTSHGISHEIPSVRVLDHQSKRFPRSSVKVLKRWFTANIHNPHPTEAQKHTLQEQTGLTAQQISTWFANARRRGIAKSVVYSHSSASQVTASISVPNLSSIDPWSGLNPLERWRNSPPEDEAASMIAITNAITGSSEFVPGTALAVDLTNPYLSNSVQRPASETSFESLSSFWTTGSSSSAQSVHSDLLRTNSNESLQSFGTKQPRRRRSLSRKRAPVRKQRGESDPRPFQCTFCTDTFKTKYDWTRHEGTLHLNLEKWTCTPWGPTYQLPNEVFLRCAFCDEPNPTDYHIQSHNHEACIERPPPEREFRRRDHLRQHLRVVHGITNTPLTLPQWRTTITNVNSRCGFCGERFTIWSDRNDHLSEHFRNGTRMKDWKADRGLDSTICLMVENAMPPYLIGTESLEFEPFSASRGIQKRAAAAAAPSSSSALTNKSSNNNNNTTPTRFEDLTARLASYVTAALQGGTLITDEVVRRQARLIMYGDDDAWNQTPADNAEWLRLFKSALGLGDRDPDPDAYPPLSTTNPTDQQPPPVFPSALQFAWPFGNFTASKIPVPWIWQAPECLAEFREYAIAGQWESLLLPQSMAETGAVQAVPQAVGGGHESIDDDVLLPLEDGIFGSGTGIGMGTFQVHQQQQMQMQMQMQMEGVDTSTKDDELAPWEYTTEDLDFFSGGGQVCLERDQ